MKLLNTYTYEIKKSKFIGLYYEVDSKDECESIISELKIEHKKARHIPYAYKIGPIEKKTDDKEPSNTAGLPIYNIIKRKELDHTLLVVIRYFGGVKLGAGPLLRAYSTTANEATNIKDEL